MTTEPLRPFDRLAAGLDDALTAHGRPPTPRRELPDRGAAFAAQARQNAADVEQLFDGLADRLTTRTNHAR